MTDISKLIDLLNEFGITYETDADENYMYVEITVGNSNVEGFRGFMTEWAFDLDGNFIQLGIFE